MRRLVPSVKTYEGIAEDLCRGTDYWVKMLYSGNVSMSDVFWDENPEEKIDLCAIRSPKTQDFIELDNEPQMSDFRCKVKDVIRQ